MTSGGEIADPNVVASRPGSSTASPGASTGGVWRGALRAVVVAAACAALIFEQSPANEILRTTIALDVLERTSSAVAVGLVVAGVTAIIEFGSSLLIALGLHSGSGAIHRLLRRLRSDRDPVDGVGADGRGRAITDVAIALGLGAGLVTVRHHLSATTPSLRQDLRVSVRATGVVAVVSGMIGYLAGGGLANAEKVGLGTPARYVIDYGTDTRFWVAALLVGYGVAFAVKALRRAKERRSQQ